MTKSLETAHGATCGRCAEVCEVGINPRHPELGTTFNECTRCRACADACPGHAITFPLIAPKTAGAPALGADAGWGERHTGRRARPRP